MAGLATRMAALAVLGMALPALGQTAARQPALNAEQAIQLFAEAGFPLKDGRPANRCGAPSNPRVGFIDLNGDGRAEAHIADVAPDCYGRPGAYFAILAQEADGTWRRLIAEDGIVGFERTRTAGWNDLSLEARDSACPGTRRFNGRDYGAPTACGTFASAVAEDSLAANAEATPHSAPGGSRVDRIAQVLGNIAAAGHARTWDSGRAAFPGARWGAREAHAPRWGGVTHTQTGTIDLGGATYHVTIAGTADRLREINFSSPGDDTIEWNRIEAALAQAGIGARSIGCHSPTGFGWVRITQGGRSAVLHKFVNFGSAVPSTDVYSFVFDDPFDGRTEAQVASDRSYC